SSEQEPHEPMQSSLFLDGVPVKPAGIIVLTISVIVAALAAPNFVAHQQHRHAKRKNGHGEEVLCLAFAELFNGGVVTGAFDAAIPTPVVIHPVAIALAILFIVLLVVGDEVVQSETVVTGDEIDALLRLSLLMTINLGAANEPISQTRNN